MRLLWLLRDIVYALIGLALLLAPYTLTTAHGAEAPQRSAVIPGPVAAVVIDVVDGDTVRVKATIWIDQQLTVKVRLKGIDAPETTYRAKCAAERAKGLEAKAFLDSVIAGRDVRLYDVRTDKYGDRVDARLVVLGRDGTEQDVSQMLLDKGLAVAYGASGPWCRV